MILNAILSSIIFGLVLSHSSLETKVSEYFSTLSLFNSTLITDLNFPFYNSSTFYYDFIFQLSFCFVMLTHYISELCNLKTIQYLLISLGLLCWFIGNIIQVQSFPLELFYTIFDIESFYLRYCYINTTLIVFMGGIFYWDCFYKITTSYFIKKCSWVEMLCLFLGPVIYILCLTPYFVSDSKSFKTIYSFSSTISFLPICLYFLNKLNNNTKKEGGEGKTQNNTNAITSDVIDDTKLNELNRIDYLIRFFYYIIVFFNGIIF